MLARRLSLLIFVLLSVSAAFSHADSLSFLRNGEYVYYHDTRGSADFYRGYCVFRAKDGRVLFFIRNLNLSTGKESNIEATVKVESDGKPHITNMRLPSQTPSPEVKQSYSDLIQFLTIRGSHQGDIGYDTTIREPEHGESELFHFNRELPVFGFDNISRPGGKGRYVLDRMGTVAFDHVSEFYKIKPFWQTPPKSVSEKVIQPRPTTRRPLGQYMISLDDRWKKDPSGGTNTYTLDHGSAVQSRISLKKSSWQRYRSLGYDNLDQLIRGVLADTPDVLPTTVTVRRSADALLCAWQVANHNNVLSIQFLRFWISDGTLYTLDFSTPFAVYNNNRQYYSKIFGSLQ